MPGFLHSLLERGLGVVNPRPRQIDSVNRKRVEFEKLADADLRQAFERATDLTEGIAAAAVAASRTLGVGPTRTFFRVVLPLARGGLIAGLALSFARGLGEFGATIMFAGSLQRVTQTLPLAIYAEFDRNFDATLAMSGVLVLFSIVLLLGLRIGLTWHRSPSKRSLYLFGPSASG